LRQGADARDLLGAAFTGEPLDRVSETARLEGTAQRRAHRIEHEAIDEEESPGAEAFQVLGQTLDLSGALNVFARSAETAPKAGASLLRIGHLASPRRRGGRRFRSR
jgi:hypothetical protein